jgi:hypothetical protein
MQQVLAEAAGLCLASFKDIVVQYVASPCLVRHSGLLSVPTDAVNCLMPLLLGWPLHPKGQLQGMQQQLESISERLIAGLTQLEALSSSSMQRLEEQAASLAAAVTVSGDCRHARA